MKYVADSSQPLSPAKTPMLPADDRALLHVLSGASPYRPVRTISYLIFFVFYSRVTSFYSYYGKEFIWYSLFLNKINYFFDIISEDKIMT